MQVRQLMCDGATQASSGSVEAPTDQEPQLPVVGRDVFINFCLTVCSQVVGVAGQLLLVPAFLAAWGETAYGDWLTLSAVSSYFSLTDLGLQLYIVNLLTKQAIRKQSDEFDRTLQSALLVYGVLTSIAVGVVFVLAYALPWQAWFAGRALPGAAVSELIAVLGMGTLASVWAGFVAGLHRVHGQARRTTALGLVLKTLLLGATLWGLWAGMSPRGLAWVQLAVPTAVLAFGAVTFRSLHGRAVFSLARAEGKLARSFMVPSALFAVATVANGLTIQGTLLLTSAMLGPIAATVFSTSRTLASAVRQVVSLFNSVAWPEFTRIDAGGAISQLSAAHRLLVKLSLLLTTWIVVSLWFIGPYLYLQWTGSRFNFDEWLFRLLLLHALLQTPWWCSAVLLTATNRHRALAMLFLLQGIVTIMIAPVALHYLGVIGVAVSLLVTDFPLFGLLVPAWSQRHLGETPAAYYREIYSGLAVLAAAAWLAAWGAYAWGPGGGLGRVVVVLSAGAPVLLAARAWIRGPERALFVAVSRGLAARTSSR